jgi:hypothetical protein
MPDPADAEVLAFIAASRATTFSAMTAAIAAEFGPGRAWPVDMVAAVHHQVYPPQDRRSPFEREPAVMAFIADRVGLITLREIARLGVERFGLGRFPSRSALGRLVVKLRQRAAVTPS